MDSAKTDANWFGYKQTKPPSNLLPTVPRRCFFCGLFWLLMSVRFLFVLQELYAEGMYDTFA